MAYNGFKNVTVDQHFYVRHRICLRYANNPCVIEKSKNGLERYYPMELVKIVREWSKLYMEAHIRCCYQILYGKLSDLGIVVATLLYSFSHFLRS
ncbi:hypothetical protein niasHT_002823 [Heterodera trifolii]